MKAGRIDVDDFRANKRAFMRKRIVRDGENRVNVYKKLCMRNVGPSLVKLKNGIGGKCKTPI